MIHDVPVNGILGTHICQLTVTPFDFCAIEPVSPGNSLCHVSKEATLLPQAAAQPAPLPYDCYGKQAGLDCDAVKAPAITTRVYQAQLAHAE
jgi:hypothetical protein